MGYYFIFMSTEQDQPDRKSAIQQEVARPTNYLEYIKQETQGYGFWDYVQYDREGNLRLNDMDVYGRILQVGSPAEIMDTTIIERRAVQWRSLVNEIVAEVGYTGGVDFYYASKANMASEATAAAYRAGYNAETSSELDLKNIQSLHQNNLFKLSTKIICNGFKPEPHVYGTPQSNIVPQDNLIFNYDSHQIMSGTPVSYAEHISLLRSLGFDITPILDSEELNYFAQIGEIPAMDVGIRMKFGKVTNDDDLARWRSRHGMSWQDVQTTAEGLQHVPHLTFTMLHAMASAAETVSPEQFSEYLLFAADKYMELKQKHDTLQYFNIGGGMPPFNKTYDHRAFLRSFLSGVKEKARIAGVEAPTIVFENGSLLVAEAGSHVFKKTHDKQNSVDEQGNPETWDMIDDSFMSAILDMLILKSKGFIVLPVNNALAPVRWATFGDETCDSDGIYPPEGAQALPDAEGDQYFIILATGAYQSQLAGEGGVHHCGILERIKLIVEYGPDGQKNIRLKDRQTRDKAQELLGYTKEDFEFLHAAQAAHQEQ